MIKNNSDIEKLEIDLLLKAISQRYGYDFHHYATASLKRRIQHCLTNAKLNHISEMIPKLLYDEKFFNKFLLDMSITVTDMFRDPEFYTSVKEKVIPVLKTYPFIKIWHAGCATGEEVYSMAVLLKEADCLDRTQIYATDFNRHALKIARDGIYPEKLLQQYTSNYNKMGGQASFSDYYHSKYKSAIINDFLKKRILFSHHNLVTDGVFGEMNMIVCRNVMIYFDAELQDRVLTLFRDSLCHLGFLCLGTKESIRHSTCEDEFDLISRKEKIYRMNV